MILKIKVTLIFDLKITSTVEKSVVFEKTPIKILHAFHIEQFLSNRFMLTVVGEHR